MIANYHTHTTRCHHAAGSEEEYVRSAIVQGLEILGFSDHTPYPFFDGYCSPIRMCPEELEGYVDTLVGLRRKYKDQIQLYIGLEAEYYPRFFPKLLELVKERAVEYLILGQHFLGNEIGDRYCGKTTAEEAVLAQYCDQAADAMYTGAFTYFAHPDLIHFVGDSAVYDKHIRRLCRTAWECDIPLEINLLGIRSGRHYPNERFWMNAAEQGCKVVLGSDAHDPQTVCDPESEEKALQWVKQLGLELVQTVELKPL